MTTESGHRPVNWWRRREPHPLDRLAARGLQDVKHRGAAPRTGRIASRVRVITRQCSAWLIAAGLMS